MSFWSCNENSSFNLKESIAMLALLLLSLIFRFYYLQASNFVIDADEAIVGLMGKRFLEGEPVSTFYYGQHYMGSLEGLLAGLVFSWIGVCSFALKLVPLFFCIILILCIFDITLKLSNRQAAWCAAFLVALPGQVLLDWGTKARGGFIEVIVIGALALSTIIPWFKDEKRSRLFFCSFLLGVGWWVNNQIIFFMITIGLYVLGALIHSFRSFKSKLFDIFAGLSFFILGGAPFWIYNIQKGFISFQMFKSAQESNFIEYLFGMIFVSFPMLAGAKKFWGDEDVWPGSSIVFGAVFISILARFIWIYRRDLIKLITRLDPGEKPTSILLVFIFVTGAVFCASSFGHLYKAPRYLLPMYVALYPLISISIISFWQKRKIIAVLLLTGVLILQWGSNLNGTKLAIPGQPHVVGRERVAKDHTIVAKGLLERNIDFIRTDYWIGNRLAFETEEKIRFIAFDDPVVNRVPGYLDEAKKRIISLLPLLLVKGQLNSVEASLRAQGIKFEKVFLEPYWLVFNLQFEKDFESIIGISRAEASFGVEDLNLAYDGNVVTRWGKGSKQTPESYFTAFFNAPINVCGIRYLIGAFKGDLPNKLKVLGIDRVGKEHEILIDVRYRQMKTLIEDQDSFTIKIDPPMELSAVKMIQLGTNLERNWSIPEIEFYSSCKDNI